MLRYISGTVVILMLAVSLASADQPEKTFPFDEDTALNEWNEKIFKGRVLYTIESDPADGYLIAQSDQTCSGLFYKIRFNARLYPMISWQWKVDRFPGKIETADEAEWVEKDDYAARVYVIFPSWNFARSKCIEYVWDQWHPQGEILTSPYSKNIKLIVARSGAEELGQWLFEEHDIYVDYQRAFGPANNIHVGAIAIMTDADNTLSTAESAYKNFKVGYNHE